MPVDEKPINVGMSSNVLEFGAAPGRLDGIGIYTQALRILGMSKLVAPEGLVVVEHRSRDRMPDEAGELRHYRSVTHGESTLAFYARV